MNYWNPVRRTTIALPLMALILVPVVVTFASSQRTAYAASFVAVNDLTVTETDSGSFVANVPVTWNVFSRTVVRVTVTTLSPADNADIVGAPASFAVSGSGSTTIPVTVFGDLDRESVQKARLDLTFDGIIDGTDSAILAVNDNDHPTATVSDRNALEGGGVDGGAFHTITLNKAINQDTELSVRTFVTSFGFPAATPNVDYTPVDRIVTIPAHQTEFTVAVNLIDDNVIELTTAEDYGIVVAANQPGHLAVGGDLVGEGRITDDDLNGALAANAIFQLGSDAIPPANNLASGCRATLDVGEPFINDSVVTFRITLDRAFANPFEFNLFTDASGQNPDATPGSDFDELTTVAVFPANTRSMTFAIRFHDDGVSEPDEFIAIRGTGRMIANSQVCLQNFTEAAADIRILGNIF